MKKEKINKVKELFTKLEAMFTTEETKAQKFAEVTTTDGTVLFYDGEELAEGMEIFIVIEDERVLASEGTFMLEDGREIVVNAEGVVETINTVEPTEETQSEETEEEEEVTFTEEEVNKKLEDLRNELTNKFEKELKESKEASDKKLNEIKSEFEKVEAEFNSLLDSTTEEQPKKKKVELGMLNHRQKAFHNSLNKRRKK